MGSLIAPGLSVGILFGAIVIVASWLLTWFYVWWANTRYDAKLDELKRAREMTAPLARAGDSAPRDRDRPAERRRDVVLLLLHRGHARHHLLGRAPDAHHRAVLRRRAHGERGAERLRAGRRLHERGELPRHRRPRLDHRLRRAHLFDGLAGRLAGGAVPRRRAAAEPRQVHVRRRRRDAALADAGAARRGGRHAVDGHLLSDRADGRRRATSSS